MLVFAFDSAHFAAVFFYALLVLIAVLLLWSTIAGRDLWPFSHYPMFGGATEANAVRFFCLYFHLADGTLVRLTGATDVLVDSLHREFERMWEAGSFSPGLAEEIVLGYWRQACRLDRTLASAERIEVRLRIAQPIPRSKIAVMEKSMLSVKIAGRTVAP